MTDDQTEPDKPAEVPKRETQAPPLASHKPRPRKKKSAQAVSMTDEQFSEELNTLMDRARDAGVRPLRVIAKRSLAILDNFLNDIEGGNSKKKVAAKKKGK